MKISRDALREHTHARAPMQGAQSHLHVVLIVAGLLCGLWADVRFGVAGQLVVSAVTWGLLLWLLAKETPAWRFALVLGIAWATAGEMVFSLVFELYTYQFDNIPPFVPPGHVLLFMLGCWCARRAPDVSTPVITALVLSYGIIAAWGGWGTLDTVCAAIFVLALFIGHSRKVYALMILIALALEIAGTQFGNWAWAPAIPITPTFSLSSTNPPLLAGVLYALFDMCVMVSARATHRWLRDFPAKK
jgi:hypothetical protein